MLEYGSWAFTFTVRTSCSAYIASLLFTQSCGAPGQDKLDLLFRANLTLLLLKHAISTSVIRDFYHYMSYLQPLGEYFNTANIYRVPHIDSDFSGSIETV